MENLTKVKNVGELRGWLDNQPNDNYVFVCDNTVHSIKNPMTVETLKEELGGISDDQIIENPAKNILKINDNFHIMLDDDVDVSCGELNEDGKYEYYYYDNAETNAAIIE